MSLPTVNPFIIKNVLGGQGNGSLEFVKKLHVGLLVKVPFASQLNDLLKLTQVHKLEVQVTIPVGPNICKAQSFTGILPTWMWKQIVWPRLVGAL